MQFVSRVTATTALGKDRKEVAKQLVDQIFDSIRQMKVYEGVVQETCSPDEWRHRTTQDIEFDLAYLEIHRHAILSALSEYLSDISIQTREIDWLFLNLLTYAEYIATVSEIRKKILGIDKYLKRLHPPREDHTPSISNIISRPWRTIFASTATVISLLIHPALGVGVGAISIYASLKKKKATEKVNTVLSAMLQTYASFNTMDISWTHVSHVLEESRKAGVVWDASLFRLAEIRQRGVSKNAEAIAART